MLVQLLDYSSVLYSATLFLKNVALLSCFFAIQTEINLTIFRQLDIQLYHLQTRLITVWYIHFERLVRQYLAVHTDRVIFNQKVNEAVFAPAFVVFLLTNVLSSIYLPVYMTFRRLTVLYKGIIVIVCLLQTAGPLFWVANILLSNRCLVQSKGMLRLLIYFRVNRGQLTKDMLPLRLKWAMLRYYELLTNTSMPLTFRAGLFGNITKLVVMKVQKTIYFLFLTF